MNLRSRIILCLLSVFTSQAYSQESGDQNTGAIADAESQFLFINMLEFLAEFETDEGEWISPDILANEAFVDLDGDESGDTFSSQQRVLSVTEEDD